MNAILPRPLHSAAYLVHHLQCPVAICRGREVDAAAQVRAARTQLRRCLVFVLGTRFYEKQPSGFYVRNLCGSSDV